MSDEKENAFWKWLNRAYAVIAAWCYKYIGGLFLEVKDGVKVISIGRVMLIAVFAIMAWFWLFKKVQEGSALEMPDMLFETFVALSAYVFGSKVAGALKTKWGNGGDKPPPGGP
jgi:hypothetical protein